MADRFFPYDFDQRFIWIWGPFGARPRKDGVTLTDDGDLIATYGRLRVETPLANVQNATRTGPYRWWRAVGVRVSGVDSGITFGTTARGGVCVLFQDPISGIVPAFSRHAGLTVTVADCEGLARALTDLDT